MGFPRGPDRPEHEDADPRQAVEDDARREAERQSRKRRDHPPADGADRERTGEEHAHRQGHPLPRADGPAERERQEDRRQQVEAEPDGRGNLLLQPETLDHRTEPLRRERRGLDAQLLPRGLRIAGQTFDEHRELRQVESGFFITASMIRTGISSARPAWTRSGRADRALPPRARPRRAA